MLAWTCEGDPDRPTADDALDFRASESVTLEEKRPQRSTSSM